MRSIDTTYMSGSHFELYLVVMYGGDISREAVLDVLYEVSQSIYDVAEAQEAQHIAEGYVSEVQDQLSELKERITELESELESEKTRRLALSEEHEDQMRHAFGTD